MCTQSICTCVCLLQQHWSTLQQRCSSCEKPHWRCKCMLMPNCSCRFYLYFCFLLFSSLLLLCRQKYSCCCCCDFFQFIFLLFSCEFRIFFVVLFTFNFLFCCGICHGCQYVKPLDAVRGQWTIWYTLTYMFLYETYVTANVGKHKPDRLRKAE